MNKEAGAPVLAVSAVCRRDGEVLLVLRGHAPAIGVWSIPGGRVEPGERLADAARRELREETGIEAEPARMLDVTERIGKEGHFVIVSFEMRIGPSGDVPRAGSDAADARWVRVEEIAIMSTTSGLGAFLQSHGQSHGIA